MWARFKIRDRFLHVLCLDSGIVSPLWLHWVKGVCVFRCNLRPALLAEWPGSFTCHCGNTGMERTPNKSQHTKLTLEKKILWLLLPGFELATFLSWVRHSNQQTIPAPHCRVSWTGKFDEIWCQYLSWCRKYHMLCVSENESVCIYLDIYYHTFFTTSAINYHFQTCTANLVGIHP